MREFEFESRYGGKYKLMFEKARYVYGGVAIEVWCTEDGKFWEPYATLTKNLGDFPPTSCAYLDANNVPDLVEFVVDNGWCKRIGEKQSGFCTYPFVEFTDEFLDGICIGEEED